MELSKSPVVQSYSTRSLFDETFPSKINNFCIMFIRLNQLLTNKTDKAWLVRPNQLYIELFIWLLQLLRLFPSGIRLHVVEYEQLLSFEVMQWNKILGLVWAFLPFNGS